MPGDENMNGSQHISSTESHRRKSQYRKLLDRVQLIDESLDSETIDKTKQVIRKAEVLLNSGAIEERVKHPSEGVLDSKLLLATSYVLTRCADNVSGNTNVYEPDELAINIKNNLPFWNNISIPRRATLHNYVYGTYEAGPTELLPRKARKKVVISKHQTAAEPENITCIEKKEEGSEMVLKINKFLSKCYKKNNAQPINFFHFVLNPKDFARTIENIYHVSFLIRDGFAAITIDEVEGLPYIAPVSKEDRDRIKNQNVDTKQFVLSMDMDEWEEAVKAFKVKKPLIDF
ncbi:SMC5-SMC6 complex kleisin component Non-SMC element 1 [Arctopsyche grandis]|uniref:SMC5-SMC6 complex kleisin component Non-SMC element 1 n=1 Tax=Arctopsyche grandis TaxID=121162 RepID=UPI00406D8167